MPANPQAISVFAAFAFVGALVCCWLVFAKKQEPTKERLFAEAFCNALNAKRSGWKVRDDSVEGPDGIVIRFGDRHNEEHLGHMDVEIIFAEHVPDTIRFWDCTTGFGSDLATCAKNAAHLWASTTGSCVLELKFSRTGEFAAHFDPKDPTGLLGWHAVCSDLVGYGAGSKATELQKWWVDTQKVLPALSPALSDLSHAPHGIKIFFGGEDTAEVRVDGNYHEAASKALAALDWPRNSEFSFLRAYVIAVHRG